MVVRPVLGFSEGTEKERRGVDGAVEDVRPQAALDHLAGAHLVEDPARLFFAALVDVPALVLGEVPQDAARKLGVDVEELDRADQRVAAERHREPRQPGCRIDAPVVGVAQHADVRDCLLQQIIEDRVVGAYRHAIGRPARVCVSDGTKAGVEIDSGCVCVRHHVNCQDEFLARREPQLVLQALGKSDNPRRAAVTREAHSVDGLDGRCGNGSSQPGRRAANREHGGEVGRHIQLEHSVDSRRAAVGDRDPFVQACVHKPQASHVHGPCVQLEGCRGVVRPDGHRVRPNTVDENLKRRQNSRVARPQAIAAELARPHRPIPRRHREELIVLQHHALGDELPRRNHRGGSVPYGRLVRAPYS